MRWKNMSFMGALLLAGGLTVARGRYTRSVTKLALRVAHRDPETHAAPPPTGVVPLEHAGSQALLLVPETLDPGRRYPLLTVLHGAGRQDELLARAYRNEPARRQALFLVPRSFHLTWDLLACDERPDLEFLDWAYADVQRRYPVDAQRLALIGYSDGASYALSVGLSNPRLFRAVMGWAAGFVVLDVANLAADDPKPAVLLEYGTHDELFPFEQVALPMRENLERLGYRVEFRVDEGGRHWPSGDFQPEALDWFFSEAWEPRS
jgi:phospholipase/carboxylesterase